MIKNIALAFGIVASMGVAPVLAQSSSSDLYTLVDLSDGYFSIRENVVMVEGETEIKACHFGLSTEFFAAYGAGDAAAIEATQPTVVCVPLASMTVVSTQSEIDSSAALYDFIDNSESYVQVKPGIVMIEGETDIQFCHFDVTDDYFAAVAADDEAAKAMNQPSVTCAPFKDVSK